MRAQQTPPLVRDVVALLDREMSPEAFGSAATSFELTSERAETVLAELKTYLSSGFAAFVWSAEPRFRPPRRLRDFLERSGLPVEFTGSTFSENRRQRDVSLAILLRNDLAAIPFDQPPDEFTVVAFMCAFNEEDVIGSCLRGLVEQGVSVYLIDNWSTDKTLEIARSFEGRGLIGWERFPSDGYDGTYNWHSILTRMEQLSLSLHADWFILHDADERRRPPWPEVDLRTALFRVQRMGFNAVGHTRLDFIPVDNGYTPDVDYEEYFRYVQYPTFLTRGNQVKAWMNPRALEPVNLAASGGHAVDFPGRQVFPFHFLLQHYPVRSQAHGEKKVFRERRPRYSKEGLARGWHFHYSHLRPGHSFLGDPDQLMCFDLPWHDEYLIERLTGVGLEPGRFRRFPRLHAGGVQLLRSTRLLPAALRFKRRVAPSPGW